MACTMTDTLPGVLLPTAFQFALAGGVLVASTANEDLPAELPLAIDGVALADGSTILLTAQTLPAQNGLYTFQPGGNFLDPGGQNFDASGIWSIVTLAAGIYRWTKAPNTFSVEDSSGHKRTTTGNIQIALKPVIFRGVPLAPVNDSLALIQTARTPPFNQSAGFRNGMSVRVSGGTANGGIWQYTGTSNPALGTEALPWVKSSTAASSAIPPSSVGFIETPPTALQVCAQL